MFIKWFWTPLWKELHGINIKYFYFKQPPNIISHWLPTKHKTISTKSLIMGIVFKIKNLQNGIIKSKNIIVPVPLLFSNIAAFYT